MNYEKLYDDLMQRGKNRTKELETYYEKHHVIPRCMGGSNEADNIVHLTFREHYLAHWLLTKIYVSSSEAYKVASAFWKMTQTSRNQQRNLTSRQYARARKAYVDNHPMGDEGLREEVSVKLKKAWADGKFESLRTPMITKTCACGCGETFEVKANDSKRFIHPTHRRGQFTEETKQRMSEAHKKRLALLTPEENAARVLNSWGSADQKKRAEAISRGKKGKPTNQNRIMGERYAKMTDEEFDAFLLTRKPRAKTRLVNLRNKYAQLQNEA